MNAPITSSVLHGAAGENRVRALKQMERKLLWLSSWMIITPTTSAPTGTG